MSDEHNCGCGCGDSHCHDDACHGDCCSDHSHDTVTLSLDDGREIECLVFKIFQAGENEYISLIPLEDSDNGEVFLYRFQVAADGQPMLTNILDDDEYEIVADAFDELLDTLDFEDMNEDDEEE